MALYTFVRFDPVPGKEQQLRDELLRVLEPTRAEPGCLRIHLFESTRGPLTFFIHSEWVDEAAFDAHATLPHMTRFLAVVRDLMSNPLHGVRTSRIG
jgi:quinol monooxygenase YgiN